MRECFAIVLSLLASVSAAAAIWLWWRSPIPMFAVFTPILHGMLLGVALHYVGAALKVSRSPRWTYISALAGLASVVTLTFAQYVSDAYEYRDAMRRAGALVAPAQVPQGMPRGLSVLDTYDWNVVHPRTGKTGIRGYTALRNGDVRWRGWLRFGEGLIVVVLSAVLSAPPRQRGAAGDVAPQ